MIGVQAFEVEDGRLIAIFLHFNQLEMSNYYYMDFYVISLCVKGKPLQSHRVFLSHSLPTSFHHSWLHVMWFLAWFIQFFSSFPGPPSI